MIVDVIKFTMCLSLLPFRFTQVTWLSGNLPFSTDGVMTEPGTFLPGTLDVLVLRTLAAGPLHGYGVAAFMRRRTAGTFTLQDAALYQSLRRLEQRGLIESTWRITENNRRGRYYELTPRGREELVAGEAAWREYVRAVMTILKPHPEG
jgi:transcriptional regulator